MKLDITREGDVTVLEFTGEFDAFNLAPTTKEIDALLDAGEVKLVCNAKKLYFINSSALGYLIKARKRAKAAGGDVVLVHPSLFLRKTLVTLGLDRLFTIYQTVEEGVDHFAGARKKRRSADLGDQIDEKLLGGNVLIFTPQPVSEGTKPLIGRITSLYAHGLKFHWPVPHATKDFQPALSNTNFEMELHVGRRLKIKFRQPFMAKDHYVETDATIASVAREVLDDGTDEAVFIVRYENLKAEDQELLSRFVNDMAELKAEVDQARTQR